MSSGTETPVYADVEKGFRYDVLPLLLCVLLPFLLSVFFVSPFQNTFLDDDFAYASMARTLAETGELKISAWAEALPFFQTCWGALFCKIFGTSFGSIRLSAICLFFIGLVSLYYLSKEYGLNRWQSGLVPFVFFCCPLVPFSAFSFNTDLPSLSLLLLATLLYIRAAKSQSSSQVFCASLIATFSILTRQSSIAIIPAIFILCLRKDSLRRKISFWLSGLILPIAALIWQTCRRFFITNWAATIGGKAHKEYLSDISGVILGTISRLASMFQYSGLFLLAFLPIFAALIWFALKNDEDKTNVEKKAIGLIAILGVSGIVFNKFVAGIEVLLPNIIWHFRSLRGCSPAIRTAVTIMAFVCSCGISFCIFSRLKEISRQRHKPEKWLLDLTCLFLVILILIWYKMGDVYFLSLLPLLIIYAVRFSKPSKPLVGIFSAICFLMLFAQCVELRHELILSEARWTLADRQISRGTPSNRIFADWRWVCYHEIDEWANEHPAETIDYNRDFWKVWIRDRAENAEYIVAGKRWKSGWQCVDSIVVHPGSLSWKEWLVNPLSTGLYDERLICLWRRPENTTENGKP